MSIDTVLLVAFKYPPYDEVGGRRWARLSRHFAELGVQVHVLTVHWGSANADSANSLMHPNLHIHCLPSLGFHRLRRRRLWPNKLRASLVRRLARREMLEDARFWGLVMIPYARHLMRKHDIRHVIATGAPFWANWWILQIKKEDPQATIVQDLRDPWLDHPMRLKSYRPETVARWREMEAAVLSESDLVVTVTETLRDILAAKSRAPVRVIANGYEPSEFPESRSTAPRPFGLLHAGTLGSGRVAPTRNLFDAVRSVAHEMPELQITFWGPMPDSLLDEYRDLVDARVLALRSWAPIEQVVKAIDEQTFACLHIQSEKLSNYALSTKIFEYAYARRPVFSIDWDGEIRRFVAQHDLGWSVDGDKEAAIANGLRMLYDLWQENPSMESQPKGIEGFTYRRLAQEYLSLIEHAAAAVGTEAHQPQVRASEPLSRADM